MFNPEILLSTGLFSRYPDFTSFENVLDFMKNYKNPEGFELLVYPDWFLNLNSYAKLIRQSNLRVAGVHAEKRIASLGKERLLRNIQFVENIGAQYLVLHAWGSPDYEKNFDQTICLLKEIKDRHIEKIAISVEIIPSRTIPELDLINQLLSAVPQAFITFDTELYSWKNNINSLFSHQELVKKINNIHIRDYDGQAFDSKGKRKYLQIGEGYINFQKFFDNLFVHGYQGYITIENSALNHKGDVDIGLINDSVEKIKNFILVSSQAE